ncbi:MAG: bifunctional folylpolyglutamate synthase/dihydrofolate synthase [Alistipes sp.]|nr:bifunctional folylpolyglutamate synthase/dihydrofolate synthase [Alistipes sp.]
MNYTETLDYLFSSMPSFQQVGGDAYKPGLERIAEFCRSIGNPQRNYFVIHIAGTNGKGSVSNMLAAVLQQAGYHTGLFTSPHLTDFRERIRVNGEMIPKQKVVNFVDRHKAEMERLQLSFFEMTTAMAFDYFAQSDVEVAVIETGLGGRLDATNIVQPVISVITNIGLEHTEYLGDSLPKIAREKGGIIKKCTPVVVGEKNSNYNLVLEEIADDLRSELIYANDAFTLGECGFEGNKQVVTLNRTRDGYPYQLRLDLLGEYQRQNLATVAAVLDTLHETTPLSISRRAFVEGVRDVAQLTAFRGRWQVLSEKPLVVCDTGHNEHGIAEVAKQLNGRTNSGKLLCVMGFCEDKDFSKMLAQMPSDAHYFFTQASIRRAASVEKISEVATALGLDFEVAQSVEEALAKAQQQLADEDMLFIGGSTFVVAEALPLFS